MKKILFSMCCFLTTLLMLTSCQHDALESSNQTKEANHTSQYTIPADSAMMYLAEFMKDFEYPTTRGEEERTIASFDAITLTPQLTRSNPDCDTLLYVANFANNKGYAILAGDSRIPERILAVVDNGSMSGQQLQTAMTTSSQNHGQPNFAGFPSTGPGFFTTPQTGSEIFMNPNTVNLYIAEKNATLVGNFETDNNTRSQQITRRIVSPTGGTNFSGTICVDYALQQLQNSKNTGLSPPDGLGGGGSSDQVTPLLTQFVEWRQHAPFNNLYPIRTSFSDLTTKATAPAGCFPLSIAKLMAYYEIPKNGTIHGYQINWNAIKNSLNTSVGKNSAARLLYEISVGCDCWYFFEGTFTFPFMAMTFMDNIGFLNARSEDYSFSATKDMLDQRKPVIIYAMPNIDVTKSHCWIIDGYKIKRDPLLSDANGGNIHMVHCDFGWGGNQNGYYVSGIFQNGNAQNEYDSTNHSMSINYNTLMRIVKF